jgi:hypothetical protein
MFHPYKEFSPLLELSDELSDTCQSLSTFLLRKQTDRGQRRTQREGHVDLSS